MADEVMRPSKTSEPVQVVVAPGATPPVKPRKGWLAHLLGGGGADAQVVVYHHSTLFYWWPVWLLGYVFALYTYVDNKHLAIVPAGTEAVESREIDVGHGKREERHVLILPPGKELVRKTDAKGDRAIFQPTIYTTSHRPIGTIYALTLLVVIAMTSISVRGLWSLFVFLLVVMLTIIFQLAGWWEIIFHNLGQLSVYINLGGYLLISSVLFALWVINVFFFDRQTYMIFTPGQVRVRLVIGGEETVYDAAGMVVQRQRNDMFRHWVLGFGSGDLLIRPAGVAYPLELPNVFNVSQVVRRIEKMVQEKVVVHGGTEAH
jgi:hypothetical protein